MKTAQEIIELLHMKPLPREGGYYVESYRADEKIAEGALPKRYTGQRNLSSAILYLLTPDTFSRLHRLNTDEIFHFYLGNAVTMLLLHPDGSSQTIVLGPDITNGQHVQMLVPRGTWQGCFLNTGNKFALMGTTVAPAFQFDDFEPTNRQQFLLQYQDQKDLIVQLTRQD